MQLKVNGQNIVATPSEMQVTILDLDDADSSVRTADGTLNRDRVAVKRQIDLTWSMLSNVQISQILKAMDAVFFEFTFPDPMEDKNITKRVYVGNRAAPMAFVKNGVTWYKDFKITLTER